MGNGDYSGFHAERIFGEAFSPVCSPDLMTGENRILEPADLKNHRLLHVDWSMSGIPLPNWKMWSKAAGIEDIGLEHGPHFTVESMAIESAINGNGIALVSHHAAAEDLDSGRLVKPFDLTLPTDFSFWVVCPKEYMRRANVRCFSNWILHQAAGDILEVISE
jgi:LysR family glycine cleavage system transcriptional activator